MLLRVFNKVFKRLTPLVLGANLFLSSTPLSAFLASVKGAGMAVTGVAYPQDAETGAYNPAAISWVGSRVDAGLTAVHTSGTTRIYGNLNPAVNRTDNAFQKHWVFNPHFGMTKEFSNLPKPITFGLVLYNDADLVYCKYDKPFPILGSSNLRLSYYQEVLAPMISIKLNRCHSIAFAINFFAQRFKCVGLENFDNGFVSSNPGFVTGNGPQITNGIGWQVGWLGEPIKGVKMGLTYTPQTHIKRFDKYRGFLAGFGSLDAPTRIAGGISVRLLPYLVGALDVIWEGWNRVPTLHNGLAVRTEATPNAAQAGTDEGAGFGWRDRTYFRCGFDYAATEALNLRIGFRHARPTIPVSSTATNALVLETAANFITFGFTYKINCDLELSGFYAHGFDNKIQGPNSIPFAIGGGGADINQSKDAFGLSLGYYY